MAVHYNCGMCNWAINTPSGDLKDHECFRNFHENTHEFVLDDTFIYIRAKSSKYNTEMPPNVIKPSDMQLTDDENEIVIKPVPENAVGEPQPNTLGTLKWTHEAQLQLISLYKKYEASFISTTERNDKVWDRLSQEMIQNKFNYTSNQCKFKFKYLKSNYMKKKDNMGTKCSGQENFKCTYFDELDAIFKKKANVTPENIASNLCKRKISNDNSSFVLEDEESARENLPCNSQNIDTVPRKKRQKKDSSSLERAMTEIRQNAIAREEMCNNRHRENMEVKKEMLHIFSSKLDELIKVLKEK